MGIFLMAIAFIMLIVSNVFLIIIKEDNEKTIIKLRKGAKSSKLTYNRVHAKLKRRDKRIENFLKKKK